MEVLILGWSDIVRRRVAPAFADNDRVARIHVASTHQVVDAGILGAKRGQTYGGPEGIVRALHELGDTLVYVSGVNTVHADRVLAALDSGHDVVVDKPAFISSASRERCLAAARRANNLLAEAVVWPRHPQVELLVSRLRHESLDVARIDAEFRIPALPASNFRSDQARGGGVVADMGVYAMSPGRVFGFGDPLAVTGRVTKRSPDGLDLAIETTSRYEHGASVSGTFSLDSDYVNRLTLSGDGWAANLEPAFSSRPDAPLRVDLKVRGRDVGFDVPAADSFARFVAEIVARVDEGDRVSLTEATAESSADLLALSTAVGLGWDRGTPNEEPEEFT